MRCLLASIAALSLSAPLALAQSPNPPASVPPTTLSQAQSANPPASLPPTKWINVPLVTPPTAAQQLGSRVQFNPLDVEVRLDGNHWRMWAGRTLLKDFGTSREQAFEARRLVANLQLTERDTIGSPEPTMEYWLTNGQAPPLPTVPRQVIPFDLGTLKADRLDAGFCLRDDRQILFHFGTAAEAQQALAVCQQFGFNQLGLIGSPVPSMTYLVKDPNPRHVLAPPDAAFQPRKLPTLATHHALMLPKLGPVGESTPIDPMRADLVKAADGWHLTAGPHDLGNVGTSDYLARVALRTLQQYPLTEYARAGGVGFYLSRGQAPHGVPLGVRSAHFDSRALALKPQGDQLTLSDGKVTLASFTTSQSDDAKIALQVLQYYGFDTQCEIGGLRYFARER